MVPGFCSPNLLCKLLLNTAPKGPGAGLGQAGKLLTLGGPMSQAGLLSQVHLSARVPWLLPLLLLLLLLGASATHCAYFYPAKNVILILAQGM